MRYISTYLLDWLMGVSCYLIPKIDSEEDLTFEKKYKRIFRLLKSNKGYQEDILEIEQLIRHSEKKNFYFDFLFPQFDTQIRNISTKLRCYKKLSCDFCTTISFYFS